MNPSLRGIRALRYYLLWLQISKWVVFPTVVVLGTFVLVYFLHNFLGMEVNWSNILSLFLNVALGALPFVAYDEILLNRWSGKFFRDGERIVVLWKNFRIEISLSQVVAATYFGGGEHDMLVLDVNLDESPDGAKEPYRNQGVLPGKTSKTTRVILPLLGDGWEEALNWIRAFPGLREKASGK